MINTEREVKEPKITLVGAGPGDAELITIKGLRALQNADVVLYDALVNNELLDFAPFYAIKIYVGKRSGDHSYSQDAVNKLMVDYALNYGHVVRLKGGDPFVFGRGYEELDHAGGFNIPTEVIPGISSSIGVPGLQQIPVTHRGVSESFWVITGTTSNGKISADIYQAARSRATVIVLMGLNKLKEIVEIYKAEGKSKLPVAVIQSGSTTEEKVAIGVVDTIAQVVEEHKIKAPALIVLGDVVSLHPKFAQIREFMTLLPNNNEITKAAEGAQGEGNQLFPVFLKLNNLHTVLIGAGNVGLEKLTALLNNSPAARVTIVAQNFKPEIHQLVADHAGVKVQQKSFVDTDLDTADLVIAATGNAELNDYIRQSARDRRLLVNIADKPALCDFYLASIVQKGDLKIAISTNGKSPTVAKRLKEVLNEGIPAEIDDTLQQVNAFRETLNGDFSEKVRQLNKLTAVLVENKKGQNQEKKNFKWLVWGVIVLSLGIAITALWTKDPAVQSFIRNVDPIFYYFLGAGFVFAMIDGAIGMSYGVTSTSFSISMGLPPASASMAVHLSEIMSNGIAGWMHYRLHNVNWKLFWLLLIPGAIGAGLGAFLLSSLEHYAKYTKPAVSLYTLILGWVILTKAFKTGKLKSADKIKKIRLLGFGGGFIDAVGGGGWGSIVLSSLIAGGRHPRFSLGTVKLSRFFIAIISSTMFITMLGSESRWFAVAGLIIGSALASPIAVRVSNKISAKTIMIAVGIIVMATSLRSIVLFLMKLL